MPRKINKRKLIQAAKRKADAEAEAQKNRLWPGTRRLPSEAPREPRHIGMIAHQGSGLGIAMVALIAAGMFVRTDTEGREG